jgi:hypothetical protein
MDWTRGIFMEQSQTIIKHWYWADISKYTCQEDNLIKMNKSKH